MREQVADAGTASCSVPRFHESKITGLMYDLRQTAGVLISSAATVLIAAVMQLLHARSLPFSGNGV